MKYNPAVRKNILLQEMTAFTSDETNALLDAWATVSDLSDSASDELSQALTGLMKDLILKNIERSNRSRDLLNAFFDETGELDEDKYLLFKPVTLPETEEFDETDDVDNGNDDGQAQMELVHEVAVEETVESEDIQEEAANVESDEVVSTEEPVEDEEDQAVIDALPDTVDDEDEVVDRTADVAGLFGQTEEEFNSRERAEKLSSGLEMGLEMPDGLGL